jgi:hypothetical protein
LSGDQRWMAAYRISYWSGSLPPSPGTPILFEASYYLSMSGTSIVRAESGAGQGRMEPAVLQRPCPIQHFWSPSWGTSGASGDGPGRKDVL